MILPLSDSPNPRGTPWVTWALIVANIAIYLAVSLPLGTTQPSPDDPAMAEYLEAIAPRLPEGVSLREVLGSISSYDLFVFEHGFRPGSPQLADLFFSMFLHGGFLHLAGNMLFLWIYGDNVEHRLGRLWYLVAYFGTGIAATLFFSLFAPGSQIPMVGASGAISGVLGFYFLFFPHNVVRLWVFLFPFVMDVFQLSARLVLGAYVLLDNLLPFLLGGGSAGGGVAHGAHLGGFLAGAAAAWLIDRSQWTGRSRAGVEGDSAAQVGSRGSLGEALAGAMRRGDTETAARLFLSRPAAETHRALQPDEMLVVADWLAANGYPKDALMVYRRLLHDWPRGPGRAEAHLGAGLVQLEALRQPTAAYQNLLEVLDNGPTPNQASRAREALQQIERMQKYRMPIRPRP